MVHYAYDNQGPFPGFARDKHPTFHGSQKEHATQKVTRVQGPRKKKGKGQQTKLTTGNDQKHSKFWLMRMHKIEILVNFVRNLRKISPFGRKSFLSKLRLI